MKAMVYHGNKDIRLEDVEEPHPTQGEVKLRIDYCGICATDIEEYMFGPKFISTQPNPISGQCIPIITGHELTGTVVEIGDKAEGVHLQDRVVLDGFIHCNNCWSCSRGQYSQCMSAATVGFGRNGGLAEYMTWPASNTIVLPSEVESCDAALIEPGSVAHHAVMRGQISKDDSVAVLGTGTIGLLSLQIAKTKGATVYAVDQRAMSLNLAKEFGADGIVNSSITNAKEAILALTDGTGVDVVIDAAGGPTTPQLALDLVRRGGKVILVAIYTAQPEFDFNKIVSTETTIIGSLGYERSDVQSMVNLLASCEVKTGPLISDIISLDEVIEVGFRRMLNPTKDFFRILVSGSEKM